MKRTPAAAAGLWLLCAVPVLAETRLNEAPVALPDMPVSAPQISPIGAELPALPAAAGLIDPMAGVAAAPEIPQLAPAAAPSPAAAAVAAAPAAEAAAESPPAAEQAAVAQTAQAEAAGRSVRAQLSKTVAQGTLSRPGGGAVLYDGLAGVDAAALDETPVDFRSDAIPAGDRDWLAAKGFQFEPETGYMRHASGVVLGRNNWLRLQAAKPELLPTLKRLWHWAVLPPAEAAAQNADGRIEAILEEKGAVVPPDVRAAWRSQGRAGFWATLLPRVETLQAFTDARGVARAFERRPESFADETERDLSQRLQEQILLRLSANSIGKSLLEALPADESGAPVLPAVVLTKMDARYGAYYDAANRRLAINLEGAREKVLARLPAEDRPALETKEELARYLRDHPDSLRQFVADNDVILVHELTHYWQHARQPFMEARLAGLVPAVILLENEHQAFFYQSLYLHEKLKDDPEALNDGHLERYFGLQSDFEGWKAAINGTYEGSWPTAVADLAQAEALRAEDYWLTRRLLWYSVSGKSAQEHRLAALLRGAKVLASQADAVSAFAASYDELTPAVRAEMTPVVLRAASRQAEAGHAVEALGALEKLLARLPDGSDKEAVVAQADALAGRALDELAGRSELSREQEIAAIGALSAAFARQRKALPDALLLRRREAMLQIVAHYESEAARPGADEGSRKAARDSARLYRDVLAQDAVRYRQSAEKTLSQLDQALEGFDGTQDPRRLTRMAGRGLTRARLAGDEELAAGFSSRQDKLAAAASTLAAHGRLSEALALMDNLLESVAAETPADGTPRAALVDAAFAVVRQALAGFEARRSELSISEQVRWVNAMTTICSRAGLYWPEQLWRARRSVFRQAAVYCESQSQEELAGRFDESVADDRARLRMLAETALAQARGEADASRREASLRWGAMYARVLGDPALIARFDAAAPLSAAGGRLER